jgi:hypothetical protein
MGAIAAVTARIAVSEYVKVALPLIMSLSRCVNA